MDENQRATCILVVDDDALLRRVTEQVLANAGYTVIEAETGLAGIARTQADQPDLILLDLMLPDINGDEVCRRLKADPTTAHIHILVITAYDADSAYRTAVLKAGADGYVLRPIPNRELVARVEALLRLKRVEDDLRTTNARLQVELAERARAEAGLREREERYRRLFNTSPDALFLIGADGRFEDANQVALDRYGYSLDDLRMMTPADLAATPELQGRADNRVKTALHKPSRFEWRHRRRDGYDFPVEISTQPFTLDGQPYTFAQVHDITERKQAEDALREAKKFAEDLIATMQDGCSVLDLHGVHIDVNPAFCGMTGFTREELIGAGPPHPYWPPECLAEITQAFRRTLCDETHNFELTFMRKNGERFPILVSSACIRDAQGQIVNYFATIKDITERKRAEEILVQSARELTRSNAELEGFAYAASHDLQEPLRMVASFVGLLKERYQGQLDADADEFIAFAVDGAKRMQRLIDDLLEYSRVATRGQPPAPTDAAAALDEALWNLGLAIEEAGATVTHDPLPTVRADPTQLMQLLQNLIGNALKFGSSEPPRVHVSARETFEVSETSKVWEFSVRDNGIGIDPQYHDRIFGVFQRLHTRTEYPGTGIGLAICKKIVERHGGRMWVASQEGQGSTFYFTLPAAAQKM